MVLIPKGSAMATDFTSGPWILSSSFQGIHVEIFLKGKFLVMVSSCLSDGPPALTEGSFSPQTISTLAGRDSWPLMSIVMC